MLHYLIKRLLFFVPTLLLISVVAFGLSKCAPGDPVENFLRNRGGTDLNSLQGVRDAERNYRQTAIQLGNDKPPFYLSFTAAAYPDTLRSYIRKEQRTALEKLIAQYGNWPEIEQYYRRLIYLDESLYAVPDSIAPDAFRKVRSAVKQLFILYKDQRISYYLDYLAGQLEEAPALQAFLMRPYRGLVSAYESVKLNTARHMLYLPSLRWNGLDNQYHQWVVNYLSGDFGRSFQDGRPVAAKILEALKWTLIINFFSLLLAFGIAIPLGVYTAVRSNSLFDRAVSAGLFMLYSLPNFWLATLLLVFFTTPEYGMKVFAGIGLGNLPSDAPFWKRFWQTADHLVLPVICSSYAALAFISRQMRGGVLDVIRQDFTRTARAKGLPERIVIWKHVVTNSLFPVITLLARIFPAMLGGAVIIEVIFNIPGMGRLIYTAIFAQDWPVVFAVLIMGAVLTLLGILVADILYARADPRVRFNRNP